jgi:riboflavin synthase
MFSGLVQDLGTLEGVERDERGARLTVRTTLAEQLSDGDSVAVNGVCLTATAAADGRFSADVMAETLRCSTLGALAPGAPVNVELPPRASDRLGGHHVQGHVDGTGTVREVADEGLARRVTVEADAGLLRYVVEKGSIAVDGVSLTVAGLDDGAFTVSLVPETLERTTLGRAWPGDKLNLEVDVLAKYVERLVAPAAPAPAARPAPSASAPTMPLAPSPAEAP